MIPIERHQRILALVEQRGAVSINELTEILGVSHMTIRRDVSKLEEQGAAGQRLGRRTRRQPAGRGTQSSGEKHAAE